MKKTLIALLSVVGVICVVGGANVYINKVVADGGTVLAPVKSASKGGDVASVPQRLPPVFQTPMMTMCFSTEAFAASLKKREMKPRILLSGSEGQGEVTFVAEMPATEKTPPMVIVYRTVKEGTGVCMLSAMASDSVDVNAKNALQFYDPLKWQKGHPGVKQWHGPAREAKFDGGTFVYPSK